MTTEKLINLCVTRQIASFCSQDKESRRLCTYFRENYDEDCMYHRAELDGMCDNPQAQINS